MKKTHRLMICLGIILMLTICYKIYEGNVSSAYYEIINTTGKKVDELYLYEIGSDSKGKNYASKVLETGSKIVIKPKALTERTKSIVYVLEFKTVDSETQKFEKLAFEEATIELLNIDEAAGATQIRFKQ